MDCQAGFFTGFSFRSLSWEFVDFNSSTWWRQGSRVVALDQQHVAIFVEDDGIGADDHDESVRSDICRRLR